MFSFHGNGKKFLAATFATLFFFSFTEVISTLQSFACFDPHSYLCSSLIFLTPLRHRHNRFLTLRYDFVRVIRAPSVYEKGCPHPSQAILSYQRSYCHRSLRARVLGLMHPRLLSPPTLLCLSYIKNPLFLPNCESLLASFADTNVRCSIPSSLKGLKDDKRPQRS